MNQNSESWTILNMRVERKEREREIKYCELKFLNIEVLTKDTTRKSVFC